MQNGCNLKFSNIVIVTHNCYCYSALKSLIYSLYGDKVTTEWKRNILVLQKKINDKNKTVVIFADFPCLNYSNYLHLSLEPYFLNIIFISDIINHRDGNSHVVYSKGALSDFCRELDRAIKGKETAKLELTTHEKMIVELLLKGEGNDTIMEQMRITKRTLHSYRSNIYKKIEGGHKEMIVLRNKSIE